MVLFLYIINDGELMEISSLNPNLRFESNANF